VPARPSLRYDYETNIELAVVNRIAANKQTLVFYAWDGEIAYVDDAQLQLISKDFQELYNSKPFNGFRAAAIEGTKKTVRLALGKTYPMVCIGRSYEDAMKVGKPFEAEESDYGKQSKQERDRIVYGETTDAGNNDKDAVDLGSRLKGSVRKGIRCPRLQFGERHGCRHTGDCRFSVRFICRLITNAEKRVRLRGVGD